MTKTLADMTVTEAASKALEIMLAGAHEEYQRKYSSREEMSWQESLRGEYDLDDDDDFSTLDDIESAWKEVKYEGGEYSRDGWTANRVAAHGGEGEGDQYWVVISISDGTTTRYFRKDGWYASYDGGYLDGETTEVKPQERLVTFYE